MTVSPDADPKPEAPVADKHKAKAPQGLSPGITASVTFLFLFMAAGIAYIIWLLLATFHVIDEDSLFKKNLSGRVVERQRYEDPLGWGSELLIDKKPDKPARIRFLLHSKDKQPVTDAVVTILFLQPTKPKTPTIAGELVMKEPGVYRAEIDIKGGGLWEARVRVKQGANSYQVSQQITLPEPPKAAGDAAPADKAQ
jgi:hypothetical protein